MLVVCVAMLAIAGLVGLASLGLRSDPPNFFLLTRQGVALAIAIVSGVIVARMDWRIWERRWPFVAVVIGVLLLGVLVAGVRIRGTRGWLAVGGWTFQPVELAKVGLIVLQAAYFRRRAHSIGRLRTVLESGAITGVVALPVFLQPDAGSAALLVITWLGMVLIFGLRRVHAVLIAVTAVLGILIAWQFLLHPYQRERIRTFLDPHRDPQGAGYNQRQAVIAIGAGGLLGRGFSQGTQAQLRFLPEAQSDFLPAVIGEEFGFFGIALMLACVMGILLRCLLLARRCADDTSAALVVGVGILFGAQAMLNLGMNLGVTPVMGIPLPFVSGGGSAMVAFGIAFGMVMSVARHAPRATPHAYTLDVGGSIAAAP